MNQPGEVRAQRLEGFPNDGRVTSHESPVTTLAPTVYCPPQRVEQCVAEAIRDRRPV